MYITSLSRILYFIATQLPLPHIKIDQSVKQSMHAFLDETWQEVEDYFYEIENEYTSKHNDKQLHLDGYLSLKSSAEKQFNLMVNCPYLSRFIDLVVRYDVLLKKSIITGWLETWITWKGYTFLGGIVVCDMNYK